MSEHQTQATDITLRAVSVLLDGSPLAERSLPYAEALARAAGAEILLVRAVEMHDDGGSSEAEPQEDQAASQYLASISERLSEQGIRAQPVVALGPVESWLAAEAEGRLIDLVIVATHGRSGLGRWVYGSVAERVLAQSPAPVLVVRAWQPAPVPISFGERPVVVVPLDGSPVAEEALPVAETLADALGGELFLVRAVPRPDYALGPVTVHGPYLDDEIATGKDEAQRYLSEVIERGASQGRQVRGDVRIGDPSQVITELSAEFAAELVVMTTHGYTGVERLLLGSVTNGVLRNGAVPLVIVRSRLA